MPMYVVHAKKTGDSGDDGEDDEDEESLGDVFQILRLVDARNLAIQQVIVVGYVCFTW